MAIAPLPDLLPTDDELAHNPWPRPVLRLVEPGGGSPPDRCRWERAEDDLPVRTGDPVSVRRQVRAVRRLWRRRAVASLVGGGLLVVLALPVAALAGRPVTSPAPATSGDGAGSGTVYVVQPGDTLWSIATSFDGGGDPRSLVRELAARTGSESVYPGERIVVP